MIGGASDAPLTPVRWIQRGEQDARCVGRRDHRWAAGGVVDEQHLRPRPAAVGGTEDTALLARRPIADRADDDLVGIGGADDDRSDVVRVAQADVGPRLPAVGRLVHAVAARLFAGAGVDDLRIRRRDGERADGRHAGPIEDRRPRLPGVRALPDAAARRAEVVGVRVRRVDGPRGDAAGAERADASATGARRSSTGSTWAAAGVPDAPTVSRARKTDAQTRGTIGCDDSYGRVYRGHRQGTATRVRHGPPTGCSMLPGFPGQPRQRNEDRGHETLVRVGRSVRRRRRLFCRANQSTAPIQRAVGQRRLSRARHRADGQRCVVAVERDGPACAALTSHQRTRRGRGVGRRRTCDDAPAHDATRRIAVSPVAGERRTRVAAGRPAEPDDAAAEFRRPDHGRCRRLELRRRLQRRDRPESLFRRRELLLCHLQPDRDAAPRSVLDRDLLERVRGRAVRWRMVRRGGAVRPHRRPLVRQPFRAGARQRAVVPVLRHLADSRSDRSSTTATPTRSATRSSTTIRSSASGPTAIT